ncbi:MAG: hypothetical protein ACT4QA_22865 [Panacagrimonas sp.]
MFHGHGWARAIFFSSSLVASVAGQAEAPRAVPTFESIGLYWKPDVELALPALGCEIEYREVSDTSWKRGFPAWYDADEMECRGSIVKLRAGRRYEVRMTAAGSQPVSLEVSSWSDDLPVARTIYLDEQSAVPLIVNESGTDAGYVVYEPLPGRTATIDVRRMHDYAVMLDAHHVIVRGLTIQGARKSAILLGGEPDGTQAESRLLLDPDYVIPEHPDVHDIIIENNDISQWGSPGRDPRYGANLQSAVLSASSKLRRLVVQRNRMHHPFTDSNSWDEVNKSHGGTHPNGPQAITLLNSLGNHVIRYNEIYSDNEHRFNDGMGQLENFTNRGFPSRDSDIYGNYISHIRDDGIEAEGGNRNVRIWGNYLDQTYHPLAIAPTAGGPLYIWRNLSHVSVTSDRQIDGQAFVKTRPYGKRRNWGGGAVYLFNNTPLRPRFEGEGTASFLREIDNNNRIPAFHTRNNLMQVFDAAKDFSLRVKYGKDTSFDYDLFNGQVYLAGRQGEQEAHGIAGTAEFVPDWGLDLYRLIGQFSLLAGSPGHDQGLAIPNFADDYRGSGPDMGAHEAGAPLMEFGVNAASKIFVPIDGALPGELVVSNSVRLDLPPGPHPVSVLAGDYSVNGDDFSGEAREVRDGDQIRLRQRTANAASTTKRTRIDIGTTHLEFRTTTFGVDGEPNPFSFAARENVPVYALLASESVVLTGLDAPAEVSIIGGEYSINGSPYTLRTTQARNGDRLQLRQKTSEDFLAITETLVTVGGVSASFRSRTFGPENADSTPDPFSFGTVEGAFPGAVQFSDAVELGGFNRPLEVSVSNGLYSINGQAYTDVPTVVREFDRVRLQHTTPRQARVETVTTFTINGVAKTFSSVTAEIDSEPDPFTYPTLFDVAPGTLVRSRNTEPQGFNVPVPISVVGGEYCVNALPCTSEPGMIRYSDNVTLIHRSADTPLTETVTTVTVGSQSATFTSRTTEFVEPDLSPDALSFASLTDVERSTDYSSEIRTVSGINQAVAVTVRNGTYSINGGPFSTEPGTVNDGDTLQLRNRSADTRGARSVTEIAVGTLGTVFATTTRAPDTVPDPFSFGTVTNARPKSKVVSASVTVRGIDSPTPLSISRNSYSINGRPFTSASGTVMPNDRIKIRQTSSAKAGATVTTVLTIGGVSGAFVTVTR